MIIQVDWYNKEKDITTRKTFDVLYGETKEGRVIVKYNEASAYSESYSKEDWKKLVDSSAKAIKAEVGVTFTKWPRGGFAPLIGTA